MSLSDTVSAAGDSRWGTLDRRYTLCAISGHAPGIGPARAALLLAHIAPVDRKSHFAGNARWRDGGFSRKRSYVAFVVDKWIDWHAKTS